MYSWVKFSLCARKNISFVNYNFPRLFTYFLFAFCVFTFLLHENLRDIRSEFKLLEKDMRTLRDAVIAREEAWDKAMDRERNCRQQLARLTAEAIIARHLCETRQDELCTVNEALTVMTGSGGVRYTRAYILKLKFQTLWDKISEI